MDLESLIGLYESRIGWATILVAVGVLGEVVVEAILHNLKRPWREIILPTFFGALVVIGVAAEYWYGGRLADASRRLRDASQLEIARLNKEAADARERTAKLEAKIAWRKLSEDDQRRIVDALRFFRAQTFRLFAAPASAILSQQVGWKPAEHGASVHGPYVPSDLRDKNTLPCTGWIGVFIDTSAVVGEGQAMSAVDLEALKASAALAQSLRELGFAGGLIGSSEQPEAEGPGEPVIRIVVCPRL